MDDFRYWDAIRDEEWAKIDRYDGWDDPDHFPDCDDELESIEQLVSDSPQPSDNYPPPCDDDIPF